MTATDTVNMPLTPYRVLDASEGGFNWCGKLLADLGADVIKIEPPGGSPTRMRGPFVDDIPDPNRSLFWAAYCVNKRSVILDLQSPSDAARFRSLAADADILIESFRPGFMNALGLGYDQLSDENPALIYTSISPFGQTGPYSQYSAPDLVAWSMGGMQYLCGDADRPPVRIGAPQAELHAAAQAAAGTMAALWNRQTSGIGQHVDVSMQTAVIWTLMNASPFPPLHGINLERDGAFRSRGPLAIRQVFVCADGHVVALMNPRTLSGLTEWMVEEEEAPDWLVCIDWNEWDMSLATQQDNRDAIDQFYRIQNQVESFLSAKTKYELYQRALSHRILLAPCQTVADIAASEQLDARNFWHTIDYPALGKSLTQLGPFVKLSETPITTRMPAPEVGEHNRQVLNAIPRSADSTPRMSPDASAPAPPRTDRMPFEGIRILDFTWVGVGPITVKHLADFGADVIRIESVTRPDVLRNAAPFKDAIPGINRSQFPASYNSSKRGLGLNLASAEGRNLARRIIAEWKPDIIAESFTPRVMAGWGLAYNDVRKLLPDVIYFSTCQQGQTGPHASYAGFGQLAGAMAGFYHITGWPDREPAGPYGAYSDFVNPPNAAAAITAALEYRRRTGAGQHIDLSQYECATHFLAPSIMDFMVNGRIIDRRGNADDLYAPHNIYRCADSERTYTGIGPSWIAIVVTDDTQWGTLCNMMNRPDMGADRRFATAESRRRFIAEIDSAIGEWTADKDARTLMDDLQRAGVPAGMAQNQADLWEDPQIAHRGFFQWLDHAECGPMPYDGLTYHLSNSPGKLRMPQALIGQHNIEILEEIFGMDTTAVESLEAAGVLERS